MKKIDLIRDELLDQANVTGGYGAGGSGSNLIATILADFGISLTTIDKIAAEFHIKLPPCLIAGGTGQEQQGGGGTS